MFAQDHYNLILVSRNEEHLASAREDLSVSGIDIVTISKDLSDPKAAFEIYSQVQKEGLQVDILVNNAGQGVYGQFKDTDIDRELKIINLNISSVVVLTKCFLKDMVASNTGKILNVASIASKTPGPWQSVYHGTKAFVLSFTEAIREELKDTDITVTALMPGVTDTDFFNKADMQSSKAVQDPDVKADPADVAKDGFNALMAGENKIISGMKNKIQTGIGNIIPDSILASQVNEQQKPAS